STFPRGDCSRSTAPCGTRSRRWPTVPSCSRSRGRRTRANRATAPRPDTRSRVTHTPRGWQERFARFVERKTRLAASAVLSPYETEHEDPPPGGVALGNDWTAALFDGPFYLSPSRDPEDRSACALVFVQSR